MTSWVEVLVRMVEGPDLPVRGVIASANGAASPGSGMGWVSFAGAPPPQFTGTSATRGESTHRRGWRDGAKVRVEFADGAPILICDGATCWRFARDNPVPITAPGNTVRYAGNGTHLITRRPADDFAGNDFTRPTGPVRNTTFLGRAVWEIELAAPPRKIGPLLQRVDVETGLVLHQRAADGSVDEWTEFEMGPIDHALFTWLGPSRTVEEEHRQVIARGDEDRARRRQWFRDNVTDVPLRSRIEVDLSIEYVHTFDDTGAFEASIGQRSLFGSLARRPRSAEPWELRWSGVVHRWSTTRFDWAVSLHDSAASKRPSSNTVNSNPPSAEPVRLDRGGPMRGGVRPPRSRRTGGARVGAGKSTGVDRGCGRSGRPAGPLGAYRRATGCRVVVVDLLRLVLAESDSGGEELVRELRGRLDSVREQGLAGAAVDIGGGRRRELHALGARRLRAWLAIDGPDDAPAARQQLSGDLVSLLSLELERRHGLTAAQRRGRANVVERLSRGTVDDTLAARWLATVGIPDSDLRAATVAAPDESADLAADLLTSLPDALARVAGDVVEVAVPTDLDVAAALGALAPGRAVGIDMGVRPGALVLSLRQAHSALPPSRLQGRPVRVEEVVSSRVVLMAAGAQALQAYSDAVLGPLEAADRADELLGALTAFLDHNGQWGAAADAAGVHRHTMTNRIAAVERLTGRRLDTAQDRYELWLALRARDVARFSHEPD